MFLVYSKKDCSKCSELKKYLKQKGISYDNVDVDEIPSAKEVLIKGGYRTVPQVFLTSDLSYYGDCDLTIKKLKS